MKLCRCGSGEERYALHDARGIFCTFVCEKCEPRRREEFRCEIFTNPNHEAGEAIEAD